MFRILHLSDLHIRTNTTWSTDAILSDAKRIILEQANEENVDVVAFTGDIAFSGQEAEYAIASDWLDDLCLQTSGLNLDAKSVMFVPGNHDVDRKLIPKAASAIEDALGKSSEQSHIANYYLDSDSFQLLKRRHDAYFKFCHSFTGQDDLTKFCWSRIFEHGGKRIRFDGFNSSWLCRGEDDHKRLLIGQPQLSEVINSRDDADIAIALMHHPLSDLMEFDQRNTDAHFRQHHDMVLRGHLHDADTIDISTGRGGYLELSAGALHEGHERQNRFSIIDVTEDLELARISTFVWLAGRWIPDRNLFDTPDGIGEFELHRVARKKKEPLRENEKSSPRHVSDLDFAASTADGFADNVENRDDAMEMLGTFPSFQHRPSKQDLVIRQAALSEAMLTAKSSREVRVRKDGGSRHEGFVACVVNEFQKQHKNASALLLSCAGVSSGLDLQDALAVNAQISVTDFASAIRCMGPSLLVLDNLDQHEDGEQADGPTVDDTVRALLDFCDSLLIIRVTGLPIDGDGVIRIGALDLPDTREYLESADKSTTFNSSVDFARVHRVTGGLPIYLDEVIDALAVTNLEGALAQVDSESKTPTESLPETVIHEVNGLRSVSEPEFERIRRCLWTLSILERGESLNTIKRLDSRRPIWPKHASYLQKKGCLDIIEANPTRYGTPSLHPASGEKILRVPRMVRDYVVSVMSEDERRELLRSAAALYFGSDWRLGTVRMRRRFAFSNEISTHQSGNEMTIMRALSSDSEHFFEGSGSTQYGLGLSYISQLKAKGFYGEAYEAGRDFLGMASSESPSISEKELQHLQKLTGSCARMIGEREACVEFLTDALPSVRKAGDKGVLCDVLLDLALAEKGLGMNDEAAAVANEILEITPKESSDYFQAKAILAETDTDKPSRMRKLKRLATRARNLKHHTVADNIVLELASETDNTEEKLKFLSDVKSRGEREYNYVRATIRRVETLIDAGRQDELTDLDVKDLWRSYSLAYSQRLSGIFDWCHRVCWRFLQVTGQREKQAELFMVSSFVWRLNGNLATEKLYLEKLESDELRDLQIMGRLGRLLSYCKSRLLAIAEREEFSIKS